MRLLFCIVLETDTNRFGTKCHGQILTNNPCQQLVHTHTHTFSNKIVHRWSREMSLNLNLTCILRKVM